MDAPATARPTFIGLTGGVGAGKTTVLRLLSERGAAVISADEVVHELLGTVPVRQALRERLGDAVIDGDRVDRGAVARIVFASDDERRWLEQLLWPLVAERRAVWKAELERLDEPPRLAVMEVPLLFEAGSEGEFDITLAVVADEAVRSARAAERGHEAPAERAAAQLDQAEKARRADIVVRNDSTIDELEAQLSRVLGRMGP